MQAQIKSLKTKCLYRKLQTLRYMKCQQLKVYRYIMPSSSPKPKIGSFIPIPAEQVSTNNEKGSTEDLFEVIRGQYFPWAISRKSALFVLPYCRKFVDNWIRTIFRNNLVKYSLVTLELTGDIEWHDGQHFTVAGSIKCFKRKCKYAFDYWSKPLNTSLRDEILPEGLFRGSAKIIKIEDFV